VRRILETTGLDTDGKRLPEGKSWYFYDSTNVRNGRGLVSFSELDIDKLHLSRRDINGKSAWVLVDRRQG
jgi:hypothetical protein